jgi:hypothetical protein
MKADTRSLSRPLIVLAILAFHAALIVALAIASRNLHLSIPTTRPIELLFLPRETTPKDQPERLLPNAPNPKLTAPQIGAPSAITLPSAADPTGGPESSVDWGSEARVVARGAPSPELRSFEHRSPSDPPPPAKSIFGEPPVHHAGEEFKTDDGGRAVFVNEDCYQVSNSFASPNALENGMGVQTYCKGKSRTPGGDLFDQLPAYKKHHPNQ